jgi:hypothetical protein
VPGYEPDPATLTALLGKEEADKVRHVATPIAPITSGRSRREQSERPERQERQDRQERSGRPSSSHASRSSQPPRAPAAPSDPIFSKPYEPGTASASGTEIAERTAPQRRARPIGALLGGLRKS